MADLGSRVIGPVALAASTATLYTVPASTTLTIRNIHLANETTGAVTATLAIGTDAVGKRIMTAVSIPANSVFDWSGFMIMATTEIFTGFASAASSLTICVSGILTT